MILQTIPCSSTRIRKRQLQKGTLSKHTHTHANAVDDVELHEGNVVNFCPGRWEFHTIVVEHVFSNYNNNELTSSDKERVLVDIVCQVVQFSNPP
jgi:hypothetical protein